MVWKVMAAAVVALAGVGVMVAQDATPTPRPVELTCDVDMLIERQAELADSITTFAEVAEGDAGVALDTLFKVGAAYQELALECGYIPADAAERPVGTDVERILRALDEVNGDPLNGQIIYNGDYACAGCHVTESNIAPPTEGTYTRVVDIRLHEAEFEGYTAEQYLVESIVNPAHYVVPEYKPSMPGDFGERLTLQEMADLLLFLESQDAPIE